MTKTQAAKLKAGRPGSRVYGKQVKQELLKAFEGVLEVVQKHKIVSFSIPSDESDDPAFDFEVNRSPTRKLPSEMKTILKHYGSIYVVVHE